MVQQNLTWNISRDFASFTIFEYHTMICLQQEEQAEFGPYLSS